VPSTYTRALDEFSSAAVRAEAGESAGEG